MLQMPLQFYTVNADIKSAKNATGITIATTITGENELVGLSVNMYIHTHTMCTKDNEKINEDPMDKL